VPYFRDEAEVYAYIGRLLQSVADDDELAAPFQRANTVMQYRYSDPEAQITVKLIDGEDACVDLGPTELEPEVIMTMDADVAHRFWLGEVNVTVALARGQMRAHGPVAKILRLVPLVKPVFPRYRAMLEQAGREDLLTAPGVLSLGR
jgi:putative sterol carrier protein